MVFLGNPVPKSPLDLKNDNCAVVYIQANIHAGEVEGKEAVQMLMRDILLKETDDYLANIVLIVCPVFNADGNEKISTDNRKHQNGPVNGVRLRHNGQLLDLNRDAMKLETPEVSAMVAVLNEYDPQVFIDLHTTNGSYRKESPAFTWMMNANTDTTLVAFMREGMMPWVNANLADKYDTPNCFYGEFEDQRQPEQGWVSYASEARYITVVDQRRRWPLRPPGAFYGCHRGDQTDFADIRRPSADKDDRGFFDSAVLTAMPVSFHPNSFCNARARKPVLHRSIWASPPLRPSSEKSLPRLCCVPLMDRSENSDFLQLRNRHQRGTLGGVHDPLVKLIRIELIRTYFGVR